MDATVTNSADDRRVCVAVVDQAGIAGCVDHGGTRGLVMLTHTGWTGPPRIWCPRPRAASGTRTATRLIAMLAETDFFDGNNWESGPLR
jgi:hypothetical protein